jgi:hypothetical protein
MPGQSKKLPTHPKPPDQLWGFTRPPFHMEQCVVPPKLNRLGFETSLSPPTIAFMACTTKIIHMTYRPDRL